VYISAPASRPVTERKKSLPVSCIRQATCDTCHTCHRPLVTSHDVHTCIQGKWSKTRPGRSTVYIYKGLLFEWGLLRGRRTPAVVCFLLNPTRAIYIRTITRRSSAHQHAFHTQCFVPSHPLPIRFIGSSIITNHSVRVHCGTARSCEPSRAVMTLFMGDPLYHTTHTRTGHLASLLHAVALHTAL